jgi:potassium/hydrogen antiporter
MNFSSFETLLLTGALLIVVSIAIARFSETSGLPVLLIFLIVGMAAGQEGPGGFVFNDFNLAQRIGIVCLIFILFAGGLDTRWYEVSPRLKQALSLSTLGVLLTALSAGFFLHLVLNRPWLECFLLGAIISSTDAAAVFSVLRAKAIRLKPGLRPLLELESGSNDPMAVFLTIAVIALLTKPVDTGGALIVSILFLKQFGWGTLFGLGGGKLLIWLFNRARFSYEGFYPVFGMAYALGLYGAAGVAGGSGFLAVYLAGLIVGNSRVSKRNSLLRFFDGLAWLSQIGMFLTLGLLAVPSLLLTITPAGIAAAAFLMLVARPLGVFISLATSSLNWREKTFVSWVGLRGAVPVVLATYALQANLESGMWIFNVVFFIVISSALLQGWSIPLAARFLDVAQSKSEKSTDEEDVVEYFVPPDSPVINKPLVDIPLPPHVRIVLISRDGNFLVPHGDTVLLDGDVLMTLCRPAQGPIVQALLSGKEQRL